MKPFWIALQFLTVFPIHLKDMPTQQQNAQALLFYPWVGLLIGGILWIVTLLLEGLPILLLATLCLILWIWLTGGLHLDGLADTADAWVGGFGDRERTLNIMKDPSCGPIGVLSLIILCLLKFSCLYVLIEQKLQLYLLIFPMLGRLVPLYLFVTTPYVRKRGLGSSIGQYLPKKWVWFSLTLCFMLPFLLGWKGLISAVVGFLILLYLRTQFMQRIKGITGDTIGASIEIVEVGSLLSLVILSFYL